MTSTSVKDVSTVMQSVPPATGFGAQAVKEGTFTEVFNRQTNRETSQEVKSAPERKSFEQTENVKSADGVNEAVKPETEQTVSEPQKQEAVEKAEMPDGEELEKAMEVLVTAAEQMITQLAQTFEISEEAVTQVMDELGMEPMDVLKPDMLSNLMLEIGGAQDSMELLTNEALYNDFKAVMSELETVLDGCAGQLDVLPEEISEVVQEVSLHFDDHVRTEEPEVNILSTPARTADESPVIEIIDETQITASDEAIVQEPDEETDIAGTKQFVETKSSVEMQDEMNASDMSRRGRQNDSNADRHENMMPAQVGQNRMQVEVNQTTQTTMTGFATDMETQDIMRQIMDYMRVQIKPDMSNVEMQLHPASLGTLQVQVASKGGVVTAQFITQSETVKAALESQMIQLQESFAEQGVKVEAIEVTVQTHQFESSLEQGRGNSEEPQERRNGRVRRLVLDGQLTADELKDLNAEELLTARIMEANGNERK